MTETAPEGRTLTIFIPPIDPETPRRCNRPTKSGHPCRNAMHSYSGTSLLPDILMPVPCSAHMTGDERDLYTALIDHIADKLTEAENAAEQQGREAERREAEYRSRAEARQAEEARHFRTHDHQGRQIVVLDGRLTYAWSGSPELAIGDTVRVPGPYFDPYPRNCKVTSLGSSYIGSLVEITSLISSAAEA